MLWQVGKWFDDTVGWLAGGARVGGGQATSLPAAAVVVVAAVAAFAVAEIAVNFECPLEQVVSIRAAEFE